MHREVFGRCKGIRWSLISLCLPAFFVLSEGWLFAQSQVLRFEHFTIEQGLPQNSVYSICRDDCGFLWFGTSDGLCRFDGYEIITYRHDEKDSASLPDNFIRQLIPDSDGKLWIGTENGLCVYNPVTNLFRRFSMEKVNEQNLNARPLALDSKGKLWFWVAHKGVFTIDISSYEIEKITFPEQFETLIKDHYGSKAVCDGKILVFNSPKGVVIYDLEQAKIKAHVFSEFPSLFVASFLIDHDSIWIGTRDGVLKMSAATGKFREIRKIMVGSKVKNLGLIQCMERTAGNKVLLGTATQGFYWADNNLQKADYYSHDISGSNALSSDVVTGFFSDNYGILWIATDGGGLNKVNLEPIFGHYKQVSGEENGLSSDFIKCFLKTAKGEVFVGTFDGGLNLTDRNARHTLAFKHNAQDQKSIAANCVAALLQDRQKVIWVGTSKGISRFNPLNHTFDNFKLDPDPLNNQVTALFERKNGTILVGTSNNTFVFDPRSEPKFEKIAHAGLSKINSFSETSGGKIVCSNNYHHFSGNPFYAGTNPQGSFISFANTNSVCLSEDGNVWLATRQGLEKRSTEGALLEKYTEKDGFANYHLYGILPSGNNTFWISSNKGISKWNGSTKAVVNYELSDGLQSYEFNSGSQYRAPDGEIFFGGINGYNCFYPDSNDIQPFNPRIAITACWVLDKEYHSDTSIAFKKTLNLNYDENTLAFHFSALDFRSIAKNRYAYRLVGLDSNWVDLGKEHHLRFAGLAPGKYALQLKAANHEGTWTQPPETLFILISPPFWRRTWFVICLILIFLGGFGILIKYLSERKLRKQIGVLERQNELEKERMRISRDMHDEIGSGLSRISILSHIALGELNVPGKPRDQIEVIAQNSKQLISNIGEIIWSLNPDHDSVSGLVAYMNEYAQKYFEHLPFQVNIHHTNNVFETHIPVSHLVRRNVFLVFKEILHNVLKHSKGNQVEIRIAVEGGELRISVSDNGVGILEDPGRKNQNGLKNMRKRMEAISGRIEIMSDKEKGTSIIVSLPI